jgi:hypothetical protein
VIEWMSREVSKFIRETLTGYTRSSKAINKKIQEGSRRDKEKVCGKQQLPFSPYYYYFCKKNRKRKSFQCKVSGKKITMCLTPKF